MSGLNRFKNDIKSFDLVIIRSAKYNVSVQLGSQFRKS